MLSTVLHKVPNQHLEPEFLNIFKTHAMVSDKYKLFMSFYKVLKISKIRLHELKTKIVKQSTWFSNYASPPLKIPRCPSCCSVPQIPGQAFCLELRASSDSGTECGSCQAACSARGKEQMGCCLLLSQVPSKYGKEKHAFWGLSSKLVSFTY